MHFISGSLIAFDTETTGLDLWHGDVPFAFSFCNEEGETAYFEWDVDPYTREVHPVDSELEAMTRLLEDRSIAIVGHNLKFDMRAVRNAFGINVRGELHDTGISSRIALQRNTFGLKALALNVLEYPVEDETELQKEVVRCRRIAKKRGWNAGKEVQCDYWLPRAVDRKSTVCKRYAVGDVERTMLLHKYLEEHMKTTAVLPPLTAEEDEDRLYHLNSKNRNPAWQHVMPALKKKRVWDEYLFEMSVFPLTFEMENAGVRVKPKRIVQEIKNTRGFLQKSLAKMQKRFGADFNPASSQHVAKAVFETLGCEPIVFTKKGAPSTAKGILRAYIRVPEVQQIMEYRPVSKAEGTYFRAYLRHMTFEVCRLGSSMTKIWTIHPNLNQYGARTSRFSCNDPNLQNIPKPPEDDEVPTFLTIARAPFCARPGCVNLHMDFSQIEARLFADEANEETMLEAFAKGRDVYEEMAAAINRRAFQGRKLVTRRMAKAIFLGILYGEGVAKLKIQLGVPFATASDVIVAFELTFPKVREYQRLTIREVRATGHVVTRYGQKIPVPLDEAYKGINYRIQGSAARLLKTSMLRIRRYLETLRGVRILLCIHDELIIEMPNSLFVRSIVDKLKALMEENDGIWRQVKTACSVSYVKESWLKDHDLPWVS